MLKVVVAVAITFSLCMVSKNSQTAPSTSPERASIQEQELSMKLGVFSISLTVKDLVASRAFYEKLGFAVVGGNEAANYLILRNEDTNIGLFQGMFEQNVLTFNPGWDSQAEQLEEFLDVREIQNRLKEAGLELLTEADEATKGPASLTLLDPDGNPILIDQHR